VACRDARVAGVSCAVVRPDRLDRQTWQWIPARGAKGAAPTPGAANGVGPGTAEQVLPQDFRATGEDRGAFLGAVAGRARVPGFHPERIFNVFSFAIG
jgi:hypothetical protein